MPGSISVQGCLFLFAADKEWLVGGEREHLARPPDPILARFPFLNFHCTLVRVLGCLAGSEGVEAEKPQGWWATGG